jgi:hypothetical protein
MASARITQHFDDGQRLDVEVFVEESYPDACAEAVAQARRLWRGVVGEDAEPE